MEEDLVLLGLKIKKDPITYKDEYSAQLRTLSSLICLPNPPTKRIKPMIFFLVKYCSVDPRRSVGLLIDALDVVKDYRTRRVILNGLIVVRQKKYIESRELLRLMIIYGNDLRYFLNSAQEFLDTGCYRILVEWLKKGTERQKCFCYFLLLVLFSKIHDVSDRKKMKREMQENRDKMSAWPGGDAGWAADVSRDDNYTEEINEGSSECGLSDSDPDECASDEIIRGREVIDEGSISDSEQEKKRSPHSFVKDDIKFDNSSNVVDLEELEEVISDAFYGTSRISKICCLYFLNRTEVRFDISKLRRGQEYSRKIHRELSEGVIDRDTKLTKLKIFVLFKEYFRVKQSVVKVILRMIDLEKGDLKDLLDCLVKSVDRSEVKDVLKIVSEEFVKEGQHDDVVVYGMNVMREVYSRFAEVDGYEECSNFMDEIKNLILRYIECFKGNRARSIFFAYRMVLKVLVRNEVVDRPIDHIKKKATREERMVTRKRGKEEARRLREEARREEKHEIYRKRTKGRKKTVMLKHMLRPGPKRQRGSRR